VLKKTLPFAPEGNGRVMVSDPDAKVTDPQERLAGEVAYGDGRTSVTE